MWNNSLLSAQGSANDKFKRTEMTIGCAGAEVVLCTPSASSLAAATQLHTPPPPGSLLRKWGKEGHTQVMEDLHVAMAKKHKPHHKKNLYI